MKIFVRVVTRIEVVMTSAHDPVYTAEVFIEILDRRYAISDTPVRRRLGDRQKFRETQGDGTHLACGNNVAGIGHAGRGIVDLDYFALRIDGGIRGEIVRKIAGQVRGRRQDRIVRVSDGPDARALIIKKEEHLVFLDRAANCAAELIAL